MILLNGSQIDCAKFPDGTSALRLYAEEGVEHEITWLYESDNEMPILFYIVNHLKSLDCTAELVMPYIPNARMDRVKNFDEIFTLKYFAEFINSLGFSKVRVRDPHSSVSEALINNLYIENIKPYIDRAILKVAKSDLLLYFPDEGAMKRYSALYPNAKYAFGIKRRDWRTGKIEGISVVNEEFVAGSDILIIDDICSRGGTFYHSAKALKDLGANQISLYVTHCENTIAEGELLKSDLVEHIYTTRSILTFESPKITVLEKI